MELREERWDDWAARQLADPESCVSQLLRTGLSKDTAFLLCMLGRVHEQLIDMERALELPKDDWRDGA